ncbi:hypothetical protein NLM16_05725 [Bradyrhizobium brasilense]|uniref:hypothetical protein n=1 Tax=Bradyrhizobium brasilense TaxID=1419277 RepID=UPI002877936E|nr:hypothetical protein [Bradyrhizobium brasilense]MCP3413595.1 hypothetical protein [Bradyrhizobium brasilense]
MGYNAVTVGIFLLLSGCLNDERNRGLNPIIQPTSVEVAAQNQTRILTALSIDYGIPQTNSTYWYDVSLAGFNYVDDQCRLYFNDLFFLDRERQQIKAGLTATGATAAAIMGVTGASATSLAIVSQAFGLGNISTDLVAGTYLYQTPPSAALTFVRELQLAYRDGIANRRALVTTPSAAYHVIQDYLALCLPPAIEAKIAEHIANAKAAPDPLKSGAGTDFGLTVVTVPQITRAELRQQILKASTEQMPAPPRSGPSNSDGLNPTELSMGLKEVKALQAMLCVNPDGHLGAAGSETRKELIAFLTAHGTDQKPPIPVDSTISPRTRSFLSFYVLTNPGCYKKSK